MKDGNLTPQNASNGANEESGQNRPSMPQNASPPYRGEALGQGDAGENEEKTLPGVERFARTRERSAVGPLRKRAAPVTKSDWVIELILESVSAGTPLAEVCREEWAPVPSTWYAWLNSDPDLDQRFARARELGQAAIEAHSRLVARGEKGYSSGDVKRDRLIVDVDSRMLDRWDRRYGAGAEAEGVVAPTHWVDPRTGYYFEHDEGVAFWVAVIFARVEDREGRTGVFTQYLADHGFPCLGECEAIVESGGQPVRPFESASRRSELTPPAQDASDLA